MKLLSFGLLIYLLTNFAFLYLYIENIDSRKEISNHLSSCECNSSSPAKETLPTKSKAFIKKYSVVYIKPHPPNFLQGRKMKIRRFEKFFKEGKEFWKLEEIREKGEVQEWFIESHSIVW